MAQPNSASKAEFPPALTALVDCALVAYPTEAARIHRGAEIVQRGGVHQNANGSLAIGIYHFYPVIDHCPCPDSVLLRAPAGRCKHRWAQALWRRLPVEMAKASSAPSLRSLTYYASMDTTPQVHGVAVVWEDGHVDFTPHDDQMSVPCAYEDVVLGGIKSVVDEARIHYDREINRMTGRTE